MELLKDLQKMTDYHKGIGEKFELAYDDVEIKGIKFTGYDISYSWFTNVKFEECDFTDVDMDNAWLYDSMFKACKFENNSIIKGSADGAVFIASDLKKIRAFRSTFYKSKFGSMTISDSSMKRCHFSSNKMINVIFENTDLSGAIFGEPSFQNVTFEDCYFEDTIFRNVENWDETNFINSKIKTNGEVKMVAGNEIKSYLNIISEKNNTQ